MLGFGFALITLDGPSESLSNDKLATACPASPLAGLISWDTTSAALFLPSYCLLCFTKARPSDNTTDIVSPMVSLVCRDFGRSGRVNSESSFVPARTVDWWAKNHNNEPKQTKLQQEDGKWLEVIP